MKYYTRLTYISPTHVAFDFKITTNDGVFTFTEGNIIIDDEYNYNIDSTIFQFKASEDYKKEDNVYREKCEEIIKENIVENCKERAAFIFKRIKKIKK